MASADWKAPFRNLQNVLTDINEASSEIMHTAALFPGYAEYGDEGVQELVEEMEASQEERVEVSAIQASRLRKSFTFTSSTRKTAIGRTRLLNDFGRN